MAHHVKMQPGTLSVFLGVAIHLGLYSVIEATPPYPCDLKIVEGKAMRNPAVDCEGSFPCDVYVRGQILHSLKCQPMTREGLYFCDGVCPHQTGHFSFSCRDGTWPADLEDFCWFQAQHSSTTTNSPRDDLPTGGDDSFGSFDSRTVIWVTIMSVILVMIMICVCGVAMRTARQRRQRELQMYNRNRAGSPTMIYSVTLDCGPGQALGQSISDYMRRTSQGHEPDCDCDLHLDRDLDSDTPPCPAVVVKPPSYEEVIRSDADEESKDIPNPNPPPYSEK